MTAGKIRKLAAALAVAAMTQSAAVAAPVDRNSTVLPADHLSAGRDPATAPPALAQNRRWGENRGEEYQEEPRESDRSPRRRWRHREVGPDSDSPSPVHRIVGRWQFARRGGVDTCMIELAQRPALGRRDARHAKASFGLACNRLGLFHLKGWKMIGNRVVLIDAFNRPIARVRWVSGRMMRGGGVILQR